MIALKIFNLCIFNNVIYNIENIKKIYIIQKIIGELIHFFVGRNGKNFYK